MSELLLAGTDPPPSYPLVYHMENPRRQAWSSIHNVVGDELGLPLVSFQEWIQRLRPFRYPLAAFLEEEFATIGCGHVALDTTLAQSVSEQLRAADPVSPELLRHYVSTLVGSED